MAAMRLAAIVLFAAMFCAHAAPANPTDKAEVPAERKLAREPATETHQPWNHTEDKYPYTKQPWNHTEDKYPYTKQPWNHTEDKYPYTKPIPSRPDHSTFVRKPTCADKLGYLTMSNTKWENVNEQRANNDLHAEKMCDNDVHCGGFNSYGYYTTSGIPGDFTPFAGLCTYVKSTTKVCTEYPGYITLANTNWSGSSDSHSTSTEAAKAACDADANCAAFNNYYYYTQTKPDPKKYTKYMGWCTYVKASCMPDNHHV